MPTISFSADTAIGTVFNLVWGYMQFPSEEDRAFELCAREELRRMGVLTAPNDQEVTLPASWIKALLFGPSHRELATEIELRGRRGFTAGCLLWSAFLYSQTGRRVTRNAAIEVLMQATERRLTPELPMRPYANRPEIQKSWQEMKAVAHLWAGLAVAHNAMRQGELPWSHELIGYSLRISRGMLAWAASEQGGKLMDSETAWELPDSVEPLPLVEMDPEAIPAFIRAFATSRRW